MRTTLYTISDLYRDLLNAIEDGTIEDPQAIDDTLEGIQQEFDEKCESVACLYKSISAEADALEAEAKSLAERATYKRRACERLRNYVASNMRSIGQEKLETPRCRLTFRRSESLNILDDKTLFNSLRDAGLGELARTEETIKFDKTGIKKAFKEGTVLDGAEVVTNQNLQIK